MTLSPLWVLNGLICLKSNPLHPGCYALCLVEIGKVALEKKIFNFFFQMNVFSLFRYNLPFKGMFPFTWIKLESSTQIKNALCIICLKLAQWVLEKGLTFRQCIFAICCFHPMERGVTLHLKNNKLA